MVVSYLTVFSFKGYIVNKNEKQVEINRNNSNILNK